MIFVRPFDRFSWSGNRCVLLVVASHRPGVPGRAEWRILVAFIIIIIIIIIIVVVVAFLSATRTRSHRSVGGPSRTPLGARSG
jgi:heme/copper-type cytochrome/quinol oxidase subunit 2